MWEPLDPLGRIVIPFYVDDSYASGRSEINRAMESLEKVLGCFEFRNVKSSAGAKNFPNGGVVFRKNAKGDTCGSLIGFYPWQDVSVSQKRWSINSFFGC
jgi:hypothetical protein